MTHIQQANGIGAGPGNEARPFTVGRPFHHDGVFRLAFQAVQGQATGVVARFQQEAVAGLQTGEVLPVVVGTGAIVHRHGRPRGQHETEQTDDVHKGLRKVLPL